MAAVRRTADQLTLFPDHSAPETTKPGGRPGFSVRESARARRLSIKVFPRGRVEVVVPKRTRPAEVEAFVSDNRQWIARALESFADELSPESYRLPSRIELPAIDRRVIVTYRNAPGTVRVRERGNTLIVSGAVHDEMQCAKALRRWLSRTARDQLGRQLADLSADLDLSYRKLHIRAQRTCWSSHSSSGTISLNLCLLFLDPPVVRYLMVHELCHGRHMDHSPRFWRLVARHEPGYRRLDRKLGDSWRAVPGWVGIY